MYQVTHAMVFNYLIITECSTGESGSVLLPRPSLSTDSLQLHRTKTNYNWFLCKTTFVLTPHPTPFGFRVFCGWCAQVKVKLRALLSGGDGFTDRWRCDETQFSCNQLPNEKITQTQAQSQSNWLTVYLIFCSRQFIYMRCVCLCMFVCEDVCVFST